MRGLESSYGRMSGAGNLVWMALQRGVWIIHSEGVHRECVFGPQICSVDFPHILIPSNVFQNITTNSSDGEERGSIYI
jgi:hypothetical protein